jgi:anaerobic magnesium-protoporphyrin IX monomethyl ester cyclase
MKILLVNPPRIQLIQAGVPGVLHRGGGFSFPPLGLLYLAAAVEKEQLAEVTILDAQWGNISYEDIGRYAASFGADVVGVTTMTTNLVDAWEVLKAVKQYRPEAVTVMGGPHVSQYPEESTRLASIDYVLVGEAEQTFPSFLQAIQGKQIDLNSISGLHWVDANGSSHSNDNSAYINNLDLLPFPNRTKLPLEKYGTITSRSKIATSILSSRGCPFRCTFCDVPRTKVRYRSAVNFVDEIEWCISQGIREFHAFDDTFNVSNDRVIEICRELINRKIHIAWSLRGRVNVLSDEVARYLKEAGCYRLHLGIESGVPRILDLMKKHINPEKVIQAVAVAKRHGLQVHGFFLIGFPTETIEEINQTITFARQLQLDYTQFSVTTLYPGTEIYRWAMEQGVVQGDVWRDFARNPDPGFAPPVWDTIIDASELYRIMKRAYRSFYLRPQYIWKSLKSLKTAGELASRIKGMGVLLNPKFGKGFRYQDKSKGQ